MSNLKKMYENYELMKVAARLLIDDNIKEASSEFMAEIATNNADADVAAAVINGMNMGQDAEDGGIGPVIFGKR